MSVGWIDEVDGYVSGLNHEVEVSLSQLSS
jgi:hypothetical protein